MTQLPHLRTVLEPDHGILWIVHRLDKDTSGLILLAKNAEAHRKLNESFREHQIQKIYHGLVSPAPDWQEQVVNLPLRTDADRKHRTRWMKLKVNPLSRHSELKNGFPLAF